MTSVNINEWDAVFRTVIAAGLGGLVGWDRETRNQSAGIRTHMMVAAGACLFVVTAVLAFDEENDKALELDENYLAQNPDRILAGIASGVGFLGGGAILKTEGHVKGLTTAAGLWAVAGVGSTIAYGRWILGIFTTLLAIAIQISDIVLYRFLCVKKDEDAEKEQEDQDGKDVTEEKEK